MNNFKTGFFIGLGVLTAAAVIGIVGGKVKL